MTDDRLTGRAPVRRFKPSAASKLKPAAAKKIARSRIVEEHEVEVGGKNASRYVVTAKTGQHIFAIEVTGRHGIPPGYVATGAGHVMNLTDADADDVFGFLKEKPVQITEVTTVSTVSKGAGRSREDNLKIAAAAKDLIKDLRTKRDSLPDGI